MNQTLRLRVNNEIPAYRTGLVSALDVGSSKIVCVIGQAEDGSLKVLGSALRESAGLRRAPSPAWNRPRSPFATVLPLPRIWPMPASRMCWISVNCGQPVSVTSRAVMALDGALVSDMHLRTLLADGRVRAKLEGHDEISSPRPPTMSWTRRGGEKSAGHVLPAYRGSHACRGR